MIIEQNYQSIKMRPHSLKNVNYFLRNQAKNKYVHFTPDFGVKWTQVVFYFIKFLGPLNDIKNSKCIWHSGGINTNVKDFIPKFPNINILVFILDQSQKQSHFTPVYPTHIHSIINYVFTHFYHIQTYINTFKYLIIA